MQRITQCLNQTCILFKTLYIYIYIYITHNELRHAHLIYKQTYTVEKYVHLDMQPLTRCTKDFITEYITLSITLEPKTD